jgi:uracil-DNA glycosylase
MIQPATLRPQELAALLHFYADAGVDTLLEDEGIDRFAEFASEGNASARPAAAQAPGNSAPTRERNTPAPPPRVITQPVTIPGDEAVKLARAAATKAMSIDELYEAISSFDGCNLKNSARNTVFPKAIGALPVMIFGPAPTADDDREGTAFTGQIGDMLERMLAAINIDMSQVTLAHAISWRPPGGRPPTPAEAEICRPFAERLVALGKPKLLILMGNFAARFFTGSSESIHALRGEWISLPVDGQQYEAMAMLHPQDLISAPASKRLAWGDLLEFERKFNT